jgi:hypothetical protein
MNWVKWPGWVWLSHTGENAVSAAAIAAMSVLTAEQVNSLRDVGWTTLLSVAGYAALLAVLRAMGTLKVSGGTDSFLPRVVAKRGDGHGDS